MLALRATKTPKGKDIFQEIIKAFSDFRLIGKMCDCRLEKNQIYQKKKTFIIRNNQENVGAKSF